MFLFIPFIVAALFLGLWYYRRGSTLTAGCRWRAAREIGPNHYRCAACGAELDLPDGGEPRQCLRGSAEGSQQ